MANEQNAPRLTNQDALQMTHRTRTKATRSLPVCACPRVEGSAERQCVGAPPEGHQCRSAMRAELIQSMRADALSFDPSRCDASCGTCWFTGNAETFQRRCEEERLYALRADLREALAGDGGTR